MYNPNIPYPTPTNPIHPTTSYPTLPYPLSLPYPTLCSDHMYYPTLPYPTLPYPTLPYSTPTHPSLPTLPFPVTLIICTLPHPTIPYPTPYPCPFLYPYPYPTLPYPTIPYHTILYHTILHPTPNTRPYPTLTYEGMKNPKNKRRSPKRTLIRLRCRQIIPKLNSLKMRLTETSETMKSSSRRCRKTLCKLRDFNCLRNTWYLIEITRFDRILSKSHEYPSMTGRLHLSKGPWIREFV